MQFTVFIYCRFCDEQDLRQAWESIVIPQSVAKFFSVLFNVNADELAIPNETKGMCDDDLDDEDNNGELDLDLDDSVNACETDEVANDNWDELYNSSTKLSQNKNRQIRSIYQMLFYIINNGRKRTPLHILNAEAIHHNCKSSTLITSFNHQGVCMSYDDLKRYHDDIASFIDDTSNDNVPLPSHFLPGVHTIGAFDNFDHEEHTESGIGGTHDTVAILIQDKSNTQQKKPNISDKMSTTERNSLVMFLSARR